MQGHLVPKKIYYLVAAALAVLLVLTLVAAEIELGPLNTPLAVSIAMVKALLIVLFFMHVRYGSPLLRMFAASGFVALLLLFVLAFADYITRATTANTPIEAAAAQQNEG